MAKKVSRFRAYEGASEELVKRTKESYKNRDVTGKYQPFLKAKDIPLPQWKCKEGDHILDILPWISNDNYPYPEQRNKPVYNLDVWVHRKVGVNENDYICPARAYNKPCPICDDLNEMKKGGNYDEKYVKDMSPKRRVAYVIQVYDSSQEEEAGPYWWEAAHFTTESNIIAIARSRRTGGMAQFMSPDPKEGKSIEFTREGAGMANTRYVGFRFSDRDYEISDEILDMVPNLEDYIEVLSYEELEELYFSGIGNDPVGKDDEAPEGDPPASKGRTRTREKEEKPASTRGRTRTAPEETEKKSKMEQEQEHEKSLEEEPTETRRPVRSAPPAETGTRRVLRRPSGAASAEESPPAEERSSRTVRTGLRSSRRTTKSEDD